MSTEYIKYDKYFEQRTKDLGQANLFFYLSYKLYTMTTFIDKLNLTESEYKIFEELKNYYKDRISEKLLAVIVIQQRREKDYYMSCQEILELEEEELGSSTLEINDDTLEALQNGFIIYDKNIKTKDDIPILIIRPSVLVELEISEEDQKIVIFYAIYKILVTDPVVTTKGIYIILDVNDLHASDSIKYGWKLYHYLKKLPARPQKIMFYKLSRVLSWAYSIFKRALSERMQKRLVLCNTKKLLIDNIGKKNLPSLYGGEAEYDINKTIEEIFYKENDTVL